MPSKKKLARHCAELPLFSLPRILKLLEKLAGGTRDEYPAPDAAFAVLNPLYDAGRLAAFWAIGALGGIHDLLAVSCFGYLGHWYLNSPG
jgi:hypothetical protein